MRWFLLLAVIVAAHVVLWMSDVDPAIKLRLTLLNAAGWTVVLAPILLVGRWLRAVEARNAEAEPPADRQPPG